MPQKKTYLIPKLISILCLTAIIGLMFTSWVRIEKLSGQETYLAVGRQSDWDFLDELDRMKEDFSIEEARLEEYRNYVSPQEYQRLKSSLTEIQGLFEETKLSPWEIIGSFHKLMKHVDEWVKFTEKYDFIAPNQSLREGISMVKTASFVMIILFFVFLLCNLVCIICHLCNAWLPGYLNAFLQSILALMVIVICETIQKSGSVMVAKATFAPYAVVVLAFAAAICWNIAHRMIRSRKDAANYEYNSFGNPQWQNPVQVQNPILMQSTAPMQNPNKFCMYCGEQIPREASFCLKCGAKQQNGGI